MSEKQRMEEIRRVVVPTGLFEDVREIVFGTLVIQMSEKQRMGEIRRVIGLLIDAAVPEGNGDSTVPTDLIEDAREIVFGVRGDTDE